MIGLVFCNDAGIVDAFIVDKVLRYIKQNTKNNVQCTYRPARFGRCRDCVAVPPRSDPNTTAFHSPRK